MAISHKNYTNNFCTLELLETDSSECINPDGKKFAYWKIGIGSEDITKLAKYLEEQRTNVSTPQQFFDVGFLCHLSGPAGYSIELLQHTFEPPFYRKKLTTCHDAPQPCGDCHLGQITLSKTESGCGLDLILH